jgi:hypothetical protein
VAFTYITVTGTYKNPDASNATGAVSFTPTATMRNGAITIADPVIGQLTSGALSVSLAATDDSGTTPTGVTYLVTEYIVGLATPRTYYLAVPHAGGSINLATASLLSTSDPVPDASTIATLTAAIAAKQVANSVSADSYGAVGDNSTDDTTALQNALNAVTTDGSLHLAPNKTYKITSALTWPSKTSIDGHGSTIRQATTSANALVATDGINLGLRDLTIQGATTGSPTGAGKGIVCQRSSNPNTWRVSMQRVIVHSFGGDGIELSNPITSSFDTVECRTNGGHGWNVHGVNPTSAGTSCSFKGCYGNGNIKAGFHLDTMAYCDFSACAADSNGIGYEIVNGQGISFNGCGAESQDNNNALATGYAGYSWKLTGGIGIVLNGCWTLAQPAIALWVTGSAQAVVSTGFTENSPAVGATACIKTDSGSSSTIVHVSNTTANSLAGTDIIVHDGGGLSIPGYVYVGGSLLAGGNIGFYGTSAIAKPTVTGSRGGNAALASLLTALANLGLVTNSSS